MNDRNTFGFAVKFQDVNNGVVNENGVKTQAFPILFKQAQKCEENIRASSASKIASLYSGYVNVSSLNPSSYKQLETACETIQMICRQGIESILERFRKWLYVDERGSEEESEFDVIMDIQLIGNNLLKINVKSLSGDKDYLLESGYFTRKEKYFAHDKISGTCQEIVFQYIQRQLNDIETVTSERMQSTVDYYLDEFDKSSDDISGYPDSILRKELRNEKF